MFSENVLNKWAARIELAAGILCLACGGAVLFSQPVDGFLLSVISALKRRPPQPAWEGKLHSIAAGLAIFGLVLLGLFLISAWDRLKGTGAVIKLALKWEVFKQKRAIRILTPILAILVITLVITLKEFVFNPIGNEPDVLPSIRQVADPSWLPNDWYLNLSIGYRNLFGVLFGPLVTHFGFTLGGYLGRLIVYALFAGGIYSILRALRLRFLLGMGVLLIFLHQQSLVAQEWMVGGLETKTVAYALTFFALACFLRQRYFWGFICAGLALSFHVLIGLFALFCIGVALLLNKAWRKDWKVILKNSWPMLISGIFGWIAVISQLVPVRGINTEAAWNIYVQYRVPHHVLLSAWGPYLLWNGFSWVKSLIFLAGLILIAFSFSRPGMKKWIGAFGIGAILLFMTGLSLYYLKYIQLLRFYWFRFPDVILPFMGILLVALWINEYLEKSFAGKSVLTTFQRGLQTILRLTPVLALVALILFSVQQAGVVRASYQDSLDPHPAPIRAAMEWISKNTPQDAVFLVDPSEADFYLYAQRARLVSWKSAPQTAESVLEWYKRIKLCNGDKDPELKGFAAQAELQDHFYKLNAAEIRQITGAYKLDYMLALADADLPFERVYHDPNYAVYKLP